MYAIILYKGVNFLKKSNLKVNESINYVSMTLTWLNVTSNHSLPTVDGYIFVGTNIPDSRKSTHLWGSKFMAIAFSLKIH